MKWLILFFGIISNAAASVLIKYATMPPRMLPSFSNPLAVFSNWHLILGLFLYGIAFLLYAFALTKLPLNVAHPILTAGAIAVVAICSQLLFHEQMGMIKLSGIILITIGVCLVANG